MYREFINTGILPSPNAIYRENAQPDRRDWRGERSHPALEMDASGVPGSTRGEQLLQRIINIVGENLTDEKFNLNLIRIAFRYGE